MITPTQQIIVCQLCDHFKSNTRLTNVTVKYGEERTHFTIYGIIRGAARALCVVYIGVRSLGSDLSIIFFNQREQITRSEFIDLADPAMTEDSITNMIDHELEYKLVDSYWSEEDVAFSNRLINARMIYHN